MLYDFHALSWPLRSRVFPDIIGMVSGAFAPGAVPAGRRPEPDTGLYKSLFRAGGEDRERMMSMDLKKKLTTWGLLLAVLTGLFFPEGVSPAEGVDAADLPQDGLSLRLVTKSPVSFYYTILHYVYFDAEVTGADSLEVRLLQPDGEPFSFRSRYYVDHNIKAKKKIRYELEEGQKVYEDLNVLFPSFLEIGEWRIEVTAVSEDGNRITETIPVQVKSSTPKYLPKLGQVHEMLLGLDSNEAVAVKAGKIRFVSQFRSDRCFVKKYWWSGSYNLISKARGMCSRAVFSMALSWLGIDCTPAEMSRLVKAAEIMDYSYDPVCEKLKIVERVDGDDLETLWKNYEAGFGSPVLIHFNYDGGMHAVLLVARDEYEPALFYAINPALRTNLFDYEDGMEEDVVLPLIIEEGKIGELIHSPLILDGENIWRMDFADMERKIVEHKIHAAIICSPHNPCGRVWTRAELETALEIFERHEVFVISDEIWSDIIFSGSRHIPTQQVNAYAKNHTAAFYAPSKTFNLAGVVGAYRIIYNRWLAERAEKSASLTHYNEPNVFSMHALIGAYSAAGREWTDELNSVLEKNLRYGYEHVTKNYRGVKVGKPEGTYMLFLDCEGWCREHNVPHEKILKTGWDCGVTWHDGRLFNCPHGIRMSLASPFALIQEAFARLDRYVFK